MKKIVFVYGAIAGVIVGGMFFATWPLYQSGTLNFDNGTIVGYTTMVVALSLVFFGVKSYRDNHLAGRITFGKGLKVGLLITVVASIIYALSWEIMYSNVGDEFMQKMQAYYMMDLEKKEMNAVELETAKKELIGFMEMYKNPLVRFGMTILEIFPVGIVISLVSAALLRRKEVLPAKME